MSDPTSKPPSAPSSQQPSDSAPAEPPADPQTSSSPSPSSDDAPASISRQDLIDQASRFLQDESLRDAPTDRKVSFLESKGLTPSEIQQLLGVSRNAEATRTTFAATEDQEQATPQTALEQSEGTPSSSTTTQYTPSTVSQPRSSTTASSTSRDVAPIITYPEFLAQANKPPPLVTMRNIFYTVYGAATLGATIYGASEYLVKPMLANLTAARHDLATTAQENLQKLNEKLEQNVSVIPAHLTARKRDGDGDEPTEDTDSVTSDPTELFHRDMGTQTSPDVTPPSLSASKDTLDPALGAPVAAVNNHMSRIESIQAQLKEAGDVEKDSSSLDDALRTRIADLHHYLDGLVYSAPAYTAAGSAYGLYNAGRTGGSDGSATGLRKAEDEAIAGFKAEIRGVKGALLSARNFPAGRGGRLTGGRLPASAR